MVSYFRQVTDIQWNILNQWVATHTDAEVAQAVASFFTDTSLDLLTASVASYRAIDAWNTDPVMTEESFNRLQRVMTEAGELTKTADFTASEVYEILETLVWNNLAIIVSEKPKIKRFSI